MSLTYKAWKHCMSLAKRCRSMDHLKLLHATFIVQGIHTNNYAMSKLIAFCALSPSGSLSYASAIFQQLESPNSFIYNTLIRSHSHLRHISFHYVQLMRRDSNVNPDGHTFHCLLVACTKAEFRLLGDQIHNLVLKNGLLCCDGYVQTALLRFYAEGGEMRDSRKVFEEITDRDLVQWNVVMSGYVRSGMESKALGVFREMLVSGFLPDEFCVTTALKACALSGAIHQGEWIHEYVKRSEQVGFDVFVGTALVDMYAKCGCIDKAMEVFEGMKERNVFTWAAMIGGFGIHGFADRAIQCLETMEATDGIKPDGVVLLGVLTACTHAGLKEEGKFLLNNMEHKYGIMPKHEHYSCVVDLLCKAGQLDDAVALIKRMPMKPLASVWGALLSACGMYKNVQLAELAVDELLGLGNGGDEGALVQLSNIYLSAAKTDKARKIRKLIGDKGMKKTPGCSMIEVNEIVNEFVSGDVTHEQLAQIHGILELLLLDSNACTHQ